MCKGRTREEGEGTVSDKMVKHLLIILVLMVFCAWAGYKGGHREGRRLGWREGMGMDCYDGIHKPWAARRDGSAITCWMADAK